MVYARIERIDNGWIAHTYKFLASKEKYFETLGKAIKFITKEMEDYA